MSRVKYQVFISSTYEDLKDERKAVEETIIRAGDIPVGMEAFPAADEEQFEFIKTVIADCDYYVLILAGRYGSVSDGGLSFTEMEYDFAVSCGLPIVVLTHNDISQLPASKTESTSSGKKKLEAFARKATDRRLRKNWSSVDSLKLAVRESLDHAKATKERPGWVRGSKLSNDDILQRLLALEAENAVLREKLVQIPDEPKVSRDLKEALAQRQSFRIISDSRVYNEQAVLSELFGYLVAAIRKRTNYNDLRFEIVRILTQDRGITLDSYANIPVTEMETLIATFSQCSLVKVNSDSLNKTRIQVTQLGEALYLELKSSIVPPRQ